MCVRMLYNIVQKTKLLQVHITLFNKIKIVFNLKLRKLFRKRLTENLQKPKKERNSIVVKSILKEFSNDVSLVTSPFKIFLRVTVLER